MNLSEKEAFELQRSIYLTTLDDYSPDSIGYMACGWKFSVNIIYRCLVSGIWDICDSGWMESKGLARTDYYAFCKRLAEHDPSDSSRERQEYWGDLHIQGTTLCDVLLDKYGSKDNGYNDLYNHLCVPLIDEIEGLFEQHGVSWILGNLFTIENENNVMPDRMLALIKYVFHRDKRKDEIVKKILRKEMKNNDKKHVIAMVSNALSAYGFDKSGDLTESGVELKKIINFIKEIPAQ